MKPSSDELKYMIIKHFTHIQSVPYSHSLTGTATLSSNSNIATTDDTISKTTPSQRGCTVTH